MLFETPLVQCGLLEITPETARSFLSLVPDISPIAVITGTARLEFILPTCSSVLDDFNQANWMKSMLPTQSSDT